MIIWAYSMVSVIAVSAISLVGVVVLSLRKDLLGGMLVFMISFAVGGLLGSAFIHLLPQAFATLGFGIGTSLYAILGIVIFFMLEKFFRWRHCRAPHASAHIQPPAILNLIADGVHNLIDGMIIGAAYQVSLSTGMAATVAIALHEIPQELGDFGILVHGGFRIGNALLCNVASASMSVVGVLISLVVGARVHGYTPHLLPLTAGGFIYIAGADLIPELQKECHLKAWVPLAQCACIMLGVAIMVMLA